MDTDEPKVTHERLARLLDLTIASVSRIRTGKRHPSTALMGRIAQLFDWPIEQQIIAQSNHVYAREFNQKCLEWGRRNPIEATCDNPR